MDSVVKTIREQHPWPETPRAPVFQHSLLDEGTASLLAETCKGASIVLELGAWLGASTRVILDAAPDAQVITVDAWSSDMMRGWVEQRPHLLPVLPVLMETWQANLWDYRDRLVGVRALSQDAIRDLGMLGLQPDVVFLDTDHRYEPTLRELRLIRQHFPRAIVVGDDWNWRPERQFPTRRAVIDAATERPAIISTRGNGWRFGP